MALIRQLKKRQITELTKINYNPFNSVKIYFELSITSDVFLSKYDIQTHIFKMCYRDRVFSLDYYDFLIDCTEEIEEEFISIELIQPIWISLQEVSIIQAFPAFNFFSGNNITITFTLRLINLKFYGACNLDCNHLLSIAEGCELILNLTGVSLTKFLPNTNHE